jgi:hypothetical protein
MEARPSPKICPRNPARPRSQPSRPRVRSPRAAVATTTPAEGDELNDGDQDTEA